MIRIALIGAGNHAWEHHAPALSRYAADHPDRLELAAVCDRDRTRAEETARRFGFKAVYCDHLEMIEKVRPDACVCVMPIPLIVPLALRLMKAGMPLVIEKPPGASVAEGWELVEAARSTGTPHLVSVNRRFQPLICEGLEWALAQGPIRLVRASMFRHQRTEVDFVSGTAIHCIDTLRFMAGDIAHAESLPASGDPLWHHFSFRFCSGAIGTLTVAPSCGSVEERYEILGDDYRTEITVENSPEPRLLCWKDGERVMDKRPPADEPDFIRLGAFAETQAFIDGLLENRPLAPTAADVFPSLKIAYQLDPSRRTPDATNNME